MRNCKRSSIFVEQFKTQNTMINTTDFLDALRSFEYVAKQKGISEYCKRQVQQVLVDTLDDLLSEIRDVDIDDEVEIFEGTNETLKNL